MAVKGIHACYNTCLQVYIFAAVQQQNRQICSEETSIPQAVHPPTGSPSSPLRTQCRQQSRDSLFDDDETFELSWESHLMDILPPEELLASYSNEQNTPGAVINTLESGSNQGAERHEAQTASGSVGDINPVPDSPAGFHHESDCRKRHFYDDDIRSVHSAFENYTHPSKKQHVGQTSPQLSLSSCDSENSQRVGHPLETTINASRSSICSSLTSFSRDSHDTHNTDRRHPSLNSLDNPCSEKELSADSLIDGTSPIAAAIIEHISETTTPQRPEESYQAQDVSESIQFVENYITKNFRLRKEDILATQHREVFRHVPKPEVYISPYPKYRGPLGYFPSAPATHARCIEVAPDDVAVRLEEYRRNLQKVRSERSRYRTVWAEWKTVDPTTGKSKEQMLKEEPFRLKRALLAQERKAEEFRKQAEDWRGQYNNLAIAYNGLVQHLHMVQSAQILRHPAHLPPGHPTPVPSPQPELVTVDSSINLPTDPPRAARNTPHSHPITIDLTDDEPTNHNTKDLSSVSFLAEEHSSKHAAEELRTAMCRKEYQWLGKNNRPQRRLLPAIPSLQGELPQKSTYSTSGAPSVTTQGDSATSASATSSEAMMEGRPHDSNDNIDELARALEEELERGTSIPC
ncbi:conserved hypothetical protein [Histoplasma capsulatum G186AR]|uniref:Uncharacterized protein n=1 Tax=Ajellomyces capsulatus (strain G186AR / H82 / ATCC MYA-2454 / RMSCC 2432) TaxID=447093 RepID=C0NMR0_AJECG|nr:uncharacterized protein HCBG_04037 [Histoplasma capsulatum G186AR]EEH07158.1 conserved hypothetical protein [Histoplasma capsulatum G186AR]